MWELRTQKMGQNYIFGYTAAFGASLYIYFTCKEANIEFCEVKKKDNC